VVIHPSSDTGCGDGLDRGSLEQHWQTRAKARRGLEERCFAESALCRGAVLLRSCPTMGLRRGCRGALLGTNRVTAVGGAPFSKSKVSER